MKAVIAALFFQEIALCSTAGAFLYTMMAYIGLERTILSEKCHYRENFITTSHGNNDAFEPRSLILCFKKDKELHNLRI